MIKTTTIFIVLALAAVASAQLIYSSVQVGVEAATPCPPDWTRTNETVITPAMFYIRAPLSIGGRSFLVSEALVDRLWDTSAKRAAAVAAGTLEVQAVTTTDRFYCSLLP